MWSVIEKAAVVAPTPGRPPRGGGGEPGRAPHVRAVKARSWPRPCRVDAQRAHDDVGSASSHGSKARQGPRPRGGGARTSRTSLRRIRSGTRRGTGRSSSGRSDIRPSGRQPAGAGQAHELGQPPASARATAASEGRVPVVAAPLVVLLGGGALVGLDDEPLLDHPLDRAIERARAEPQRAVGAGGDVLDDAVAVAVVVGHRDQDVEGRRGQRQQRRRAGVCGHVVEYSHSGYAVLTIDERQAREVSLAGL